MAEIGYITLNISGVTFDIPIAESCEPNRFQVYARRWIKQTIEKLRGHGFGYADIGVFCPICGRFEDIGQMDLKYWADQDTRAHLIRLGYTESEANASQIDTICMHVYNAISKHIPGTNVLHPIRREQVKEVVLPEEFATFFKKMGWAVLNSDAKKQG